MVKIFKNISRWNIFVTLFFILIFMFGLVTFKDYGTAGDERIERQHSLVTHYYLRSVLKGDFDGDGEILLDKNFETMCFNLEIERRTFHYPYKYYGVAIQLPLVLIEWLFNYKLDISIIYYIRHLYNFIIFFIALIFLYKLLSKYIVKNKKLALVSVLFMVLTPRIYGDSFYNIKDSVFLSLTIINIFYCISYLNSPSSKNLFLLCFISALSINCRLIGAIFIFVTLIFKLIQDKSNKMEMLKTFLKFFVITYIFYILLTPTSWNSIFKFPFNAIKFFFNFKDPFSKIIQKCYYFGKWYNSNALPWHYLPVWIVITTPLLYIILSVFGFLKMILVSIKSKIRIDRDLLFCNIVLVVIMLFIMIFRPTLYDSWRHLYFIYPFIIINSIIGLKYLLNSTKAIKIIILVLIIINSCYLTVWMIKNHPYQYEYFELIFRKYTTDNFNTNYWMVSNSDAMRYIASIEDEYTTVYSKNDTSNYFLPKNIRKKIKIVNNKEDAHYIIDNSKHGNKKLKEYYTEISYKEMDGYRLYTIYKKQ